MRKFLFLMVILTFCGCGVNDSDKDPDLVYIRVENSSPIDFKSVHVSFPGDEHTFDPVPSGKISNYQNFEQAYRYGYIEVKAENETYVLQPIDYVGESPLKSGNYTFKLDLVDDRVILDNSED